MKKNMEMSTEMDIDMVMDMEQHGHGHQNLASHWEANSEPIFIIVSL
jgi:hypothetical protein